MPKKTMTEKRQYTEEQKLEAKKAFIAAVDAVDAEQVKQVIEEYGARINSYTVQRIFIMAAITGDSYTEIVKALIEADHKKKFARRMSDSIIHRAFIEAVEKGHTGIVEAFIKADRKGKFAFKIDLNATDIDGKTALDYAEEADNDEIVNILKDFQKKQREQKLKQFTKEAEDQGKDKKPNNTNNGGLNPS